MAGRRPNKKHRGNNKQIGTSPAKRNAMPEITPVALSPLPEQPRKQRWFQKKTESGNYLLAVAGIRILPVAAASIGFADAWSRKDEIGAFIANNVFKPFWEFLVAYPPHLATPTAALLAAVVAIFALRQKRAADRKTEWWKRTQYGIDSLGNKEDYFISVGTSMLQHLKDEHGRQGIIRGRIADRNDLELFRSVVDPLLRIDPRPATIEATKEGESHDNECQHRKPDENSEPGKP